MTTIVLEIMGLWAVTGVCAAVPTALNQQVRINASELTAWSADTLIAEGVQVQPDSRGLLLQLDGFGYVVAKQPSLTLNLSPNLSLNLPPYEAAKGD